MSKASDQAKVNDCQTSPWVTFKTFMMAYYKVNIVGLLIMRLFPNLYLVREPEYLFARTHLFLNTQIIFI